jgi:nucleoside-diphosphate-sugar epimerase
MSSGHRLLMTGASGFVGRALLSELAALDYSLVIGTRRSIEDVPVSVHQKIVGNFSADTQWQDALANVDTVIHLAARAHVMKEEAVDPLSAFRAMNVDATLNLATQAITCGVKRFIFVSSIGVNGAETLSSPFSELSVACPHSDYARSKFEAETRLSMLCSEAGMELVVIRPPLIYGVNAPGNFRKLLRGVQAGLPLPFGSVDNHRSMIFLDNLIDFIKICIHHPSAANQLFLLSDGSDISTQELIKILANGMGNKYSTFKFPVSALKFIFRFSPYSGLYQQLCGSLQIDATKARHLLAWTPPVSTHDALYQSAGEYCGRKKRGS